MPTTRPRAMIVALLLLVAGLWSSIAWAGEFEAASQFYDQGKFAEAKENYEKLVDTGAGSANVFYDLGNTDFRLGSVGRAILNYERTLALSPHHPEAQSNLKLLRERSGAKLLPRAWNEKMAAILPSQVWSIVAAVAGWVILFGFVAVCTSRREDNLGLWCLLLIAAVVGAAAAGSLWSIGRDQTRAIITARQTEARLAPAESAGVAEALPAGSQVRVLSERGEWVYCELPGAGRGWVPEDAVERVRPES